MLRLPREDLLDRAGELAPDRGRGGAGAQVGPSAIARYSDFTREYIARIRDGKGPKDIRG
ncbi:hypothetical protein [Nocardia farcinica]|uniref:hypothetical protein n=1 Tax=Nocardia farcinica TaxID=37329 RepID=UPI001893F82C|nr:hypothetical protein [Nocardia farcinica]MBF6072917.1 hypothetical protein [Nocardia farcinica]